MGKKRRDTLKRLKKFNKNLDKLAVKKKYNTGGLRLTPGKRALNEVERLEKRIKKLEEKIKEKNGK